MENKKQSSIEWLKHTLEDYGDPEQLVISWELFDKLIEKSKEIHKQEVISFSIEVCGRNYDDDRRYVEQCYNETYNK